MPRRKRYQEDAENHERWLISYADFITLLFAFFVVMYAISVVNVGKYNVLSEALGDAFGGRDHRTVLHACKLVKKRMQEQDNIRQTISFIDSSLKR